MGSFSLSFGLEFGMQTKEGIRVCVSIFGSVHRQISVSHARNKPDTSQAQQQQNRGNVCPPQ